MNSEVSKYFDQLEEVLEALFVYLFLVNLNFRENLEYVFPELVAGSGEQDYGW